MAKKINGIEVIDIWSSDEEDDYDESPVIPYKSINSAMKDENKKKRVIDDDCLILDFNPFETIDKLSIHDAKESDADLIVTAETGQVACRDYPHSRHLCVKFPFNKTPHSSYCQQCYCYVCDSVAPCKFWATPVEHCHATAHESKWRILRENWKLSSARIPARHS
ncbi:hypothetical protein MKW94_008365 [Papaver nudicaule]|uniref:Uncharacterized protein n=1 Tax=Papaver nudicaule TaxID=74823 RepID=A0AA41S9A4_PAPNU|nr:hypothetical protein [Papaver nudicaule]